MAITGNLGDLTRTSAFGEHVPLSSETADDSYVGATKDTAYASAPSKMAIEGQLTVLKSWFKADARHSAVWRIEAKEDYDFRASDQWTAEDRQLLNAQQRPHIVFNRTLTVLKAVAGMEINGRHEIHYIPRHNEDTAVNELLSGASKWMADQCDGEDEESSAFEDCATCGMGWTENRLDYEEDPKGKYIEEQIDPIEMYWDRTSKKKNLSDARRMARVRKIPLADAMQMFEGRHKQQLDATWAIGSDLEEAKKTLEEKRRREENTTDTTYDDMYEVTLVNMQWWEREVYWLVADRTTDTKTEMTDQEYKTLSRRMKQIGGLDIVAVRMTRKVFKEAWIGNEILSIGDAPIRGQFKWKCITGELNRTKGTFFGLARLVRDPQMWANKWLSQSLHILNTTAKGGVVAEQDAFEDPREAEDKWARPDTIIWTKRGALSGDKPKIIPRPGQGFQAGHMQLLEFAISAIRDVTGINLELLGLQDQNQPGILEAQRKQAGMTVLATLFDSLRRFRKQVGRFRLVVIQDFLSDGRLIRISGKEMDGQKAKAVPLMKDKCTGEFDVVVDDTPTSPNQKEANWGIIQLLLPVFKEQLATNPQLLAVVLEYSPLPAKLVDAIKQMVTAVNPQQEQQQQQMMAAQMAIATSTANKNQAQAELALAQAGKTQQTAIYDIAIAMHEFIKSKQEGDIAAAEAAHSRVKALTEQSMVELNKAKAMHTMEQANKTHAEAQHHRVSAAREALEPIPQQHESELRAQTEQDKMDLQAKQMAQEAQQARKASSSDE